MFEVQAVVTPVWLTESAGLGLGAELGIKYGSVDTGVGTTSLTRFPLLVFGQLLARVTERGSFLLRGGRGARLRFASERGQRLWRRTTHRPVESDWRRGRDRRLVPAQLTRRPCC